MFHWYIYFLKKVCVGFVGWFLNALLLLKIIVSMKRYYVSVLGDIERCINFVRVFFKVVKNLKVYAEMICPVFSKTHYWKINTEFSLQLTNGIIIELYHFIIIKKKLTWKIFQHLLLKISNNKNKFYLQNLKKIFVKRWNLL